jgi:hypothetical protein
MMTRGISFLNKGRGLREGYAASEPSEQKGVNSFLTKLVSEE